MPHKKAGAPAPDPDQQALEHKIDLLLSLEPVAAPEPQPKPKEEAAKPVIKLTPLPEDTEPAAPGEPINIFAGLKSAPLIPGVTEAKEPTPEGQPQPDPEPEQEQKPEVETESEVELAQPESPEPGEPSPAIALPIPKADKTPLEPVVELEDEALDKAVDEIVISESDALLAAEDITSKLETRKPKPKKSGGILKYLFKK